MTNPLDPAVEAQVGEILSQYHTQSCYEFRRSEVARDQSTLDTAKRNMELYTKEAKTALTRLLLRERVEEHKVINQYLGVEINTPRGKKRVIYVEDLPVRSATLEAQIKELEDA